MQDLRFEWDPAKAGSNMRKHGVSFEEARTVFSDDQALVIDDPDHSDDEDRFILMGSSALLRVLVVVHAFRSAPDTVRIISARKATTIERSTYSRRRP
ncbi:MAG: BrnT family toxin [Acidobacteria bacterium]|nr:BrnT family toxin [Acidobacteriota bacterium]